ncbi:hypothetical protein WJ542_14795 [Paraburkholderia sp. B3]|uniref:hypothetical protein n=1 Tax=Paraburkholderia sp. B3 TaxID=3134791 RepID=UPI003981F374
MDYQMRSCCRKLHMRTRKLPAAFEVDCATLESVSALYERAGLFAWRETLQEVDSWEGETLTRAYQLARKKLETADWRDASRENNPWPEQLALFDPEGGQWYFVSGSVTGTDKVS